MTQIGFYHLLYTPLDVAMPKLLEKALAAGHRVVVRAGSAERVRHLDSLLWTYDAASWLPHGSKRLGMAESQPIWLTEEDENPNNADILVLTDGIVPHSLSGFARCLDLFDGRDEEAVQAARLRWKQWKEQGLSLIYHQQMENGGWKEMARVEKTGTP